MSFKAPALILTVLLIQALFSGGQCNQQQCLEHLVNMTISAITDFKYFQQKFLTFYLYSGKQLQDLGDYVGCQDQPRTAFSILALKQNAQVLGGIGMCLDTSCDADTLNHLIPHAKRLIAATGQMRNFTAEDATVTLLFVGPSVTPSYANAGFWITIVISAILIALSFIHPLQQTKQYIASKAADKQSNSLLETNVIQPPQEADQQPREAGQQPVAENAK